MTAKHGLTLRRAGAVLLGLCAASVHAAPASLSNACPASETLIVERDQAKAGANLAGKAYDLNRKRSSIGDKYISARAALIIDADRAVFVADDRLDFRTASGLFGSRPPAEASPPIIPSVGRALSSA